MWKTGQTGYKKNFRSQTKKKERKPIHVDVVSFAAVIRVVTQRSSLLTAVSREERCVTTLMETSVDEALPDSHFKEVT